MKTLKCSFLILAIAALSACSTLPVDVFTSDAHSINNRNGPNEACDMQIINKVMTMIPCGSSAEVIALKRRGLTARTATPITT